MVLAPAGTFIISKVCQFLRCQVLNPEIEAHHDQVSMLPIVFGFQLISVQLSITPLLKIGAHILELSCSIFRSPSGLPAQAALRSFRSCSRRPTASRNRVWERKSADWQTEEQQLLNEL